MRTSGDPHAERRERRRRKARYGMQIKGRSVRLLARLMVSSTPEKPKKRKRKRRTR
jgi:hypothetical protein